MIRNIDRVEALIWTCAALSAPGFPTRLAQEAIEQSTPLALVANGGCMPPADSCWAGAVKWEYTPPLSCRQLSMLRRSLALVPDGFGGSDGFGRAPSADSREPLPERCVVLVTALAECEAARAAGMRAVALPDSSGYVAEELEGIADACVDSLDDLWLDDLSTPGAYWLNPSLPRDSMGNAVDPDTGLPQDWQIDEQADSVDAEEEDARLESLLNDIGPL
mmetsp:Transcript_4974/g.10979  ORF Transcript_4974/g.10979 Transcript_4974/m.10979 type:complete len:220 (-) Transcript_4974:206-865(-)